MNNVLEVCGLNKSYDTFSLKDVSFKIPKGYIMGFIGPNGAGKTTTIKSILNMIHYQSGEVRLFEMDSKDKAALINEQIGVVMDSPLYVEDWTMSDVETAVSPFYRHWDSKKYAELLKRFEIEKKKKVKELSRGLKVKLMIAVALSHEAKLLILDEPTSGLDPVARDELCDMLADFVIDQNKSILFSTHITADLEKIADYITFILNGRIVFSGLKENLLEKYVLVKGGLREINPEQRKLIIGLREHGTGFEGIAESESIGRLPKDLLIEPVTLDDIIIYMSKGAKLHE
ncbi:ABC transporter ATP-binding protein [Desulfosporosinus meridiei]|uniref:ABC-type multidrug transport system, ATPase component n=1 Tax=Desulfosporosinus meridiei (strain ATCC BAA-275 / DSM 13257 / KCTC 12902 / NCIMB 13706 / S10) TaxID=768704 RepID=J7INH5_DESMD|nr:ABC transporter ATP-binding protein [Desulfosporosinus meridiei]AFQ43357.1 ABC-type multidrug transport system, ATPase component [Desulfosporosinus meridiei DSM 13257]